MGPYLAIPASLHTVTASLYTGTASKLTGAASLLTVSRLATPLWSSQPDQRIFPRPEHLHEQVLRAEQPEQPGACWETIEKLLSAVLGREVRHVAYPELYGLRVHSRSARAQLRR